MSRSFLQAALLVAVLWLVQHYWPRRELRHGAGVVIAPADPIQTSMAPYSLGKIAGYELTAVAAYDITARVLSTRRYRFEDGYELVPMDVAAGWGRMSDETVLDHLEISQQFRFYFYQWRGNPPLPPAEITAHSANMHLIPANRDIEKAIFGLRRGSLVHLQGELVNARNAEGRTWNTSLSRTDSGKGACELMCVESIDFPPPHAIAPESKMAASR